MNQIFYLMTTINVELRVDYNLRQISAILEKSTVWLSYKDQKHDLFIQETNIAGYLTGPVGTAGYLTAGPANSTKLPDAPPPLQQSSIHQDDDD